MMDLVLEAWVSGLIERTKTEWMLGKGKPWQPGEKLRLLFAGYNGTRNMGSDVRVEEMLRHDALHTPVPPTIAHRLSESIGQMPAPPRPWWRRLFGS